MQSFKQFLSESEARFNALEAKYIPIFVKALENPLRGTSLNNWKIYTSKVAAGINGQQKWDQLSVHSQLHTLAKAMFGSTVAVDPTAPRYEYADWLLRQVLKEHLKAEDLHKVSEDLAFFDDMKIRRRLDPDNRDINKYNWTVLAHAVKTWKKAIGPEKITATEAKKKFESSITIVYQGPECTVYIPHTEAASKWLGKDTRWCTAYKTGQTWFDRYNNQGYLLVFVYEKTIIGEDKQELIQYHAPSWKNAWGEFARGAPYGMDFSPSPVEMRGVMDEWREDVQIMDVDDRHVPFDEIYRVARKIWEGPTGKQYGEYFIPAMWRLGARAALNVASHTDVDEVKKGLQKLIDGGQL